jgi:large subunit ribosomal protein L29
MEFKEIKAKSRIELQKMLAEARESLRQLRFKNANGQLKAVRDIRVAKKDAARILTVLNSASTDKQD